LHPFSAYIRLLGRGKTLSRGLSADEAERAMAMILDGAARPEQIGAFLMLLRMKEESAAEIAGFVRAARARLPAPPEPRPDLDWPSYAGKARRPPWHLLAALRLAGAGFSVALHGLDGSTPGRLYAGETLSRLGLPPARDFAEAATQLRQRRFAYLPLDRFAPELAHLLLLKPVLGLRSAVNTVARSLNPFAAPASLQAAFHPGYVPIHRDAALALGDARVWSFRGDGGENERRPEKPVEIAAAEHGVARDFTLPPLIDATAGKEGPPQVEALVEAWRGGDARAEAAIVGTMAMALGLRGAAADEALAEARALWAARDREHFLEGVPARAAPAAAVVGEVFLVGAGPGEADLLTLRAKALIERAEVVLYDRLVDRSILALLPPDAEKVYVGKQADHHAVPQDEIGRLLIAHAQRGKRVLRLKGGDPFLFGRGGEEIEALAEAGVPFEVCPGVTAALGCAAYAGIPLTHRDHAQVCIFVTAQGRAGRLDHDWPALMRPGQTVAVYMGLNQIEALTEDAVAKGVDPATPAAIIENGARAGQRVVTGTLATLAQGARAAALRGPTIIIVGSVVTLREKLAWFGRGD
jgi:uroporphyrin-III C-methyltransferase / precorrin-2 dehydrogenase / sirohydrochlorin ferrochelatase